MAVNPYQLAQLQTQISETGAKKKQMAQEALHQTKKQRGKLGELFQKDMLRAEEETRKELEKKRKKSFLEQVAPIAGLFGAPWVGALVGGLSKGYGAKRGAKHAQGQVARARALAKIDPRWRRLFTGEEARGYESKTKGAFDRMEAAAKKAGKPGAILGASAKGALGAYAMRKMGEGALGEGGGGLEGLFEEGGFKELFTGLMQDESKQGLLASIFGAIGEASSEY